MLHISSDRSLPVHFQRETFCDQSVTSKVIALHQGRTDNIRCTRLLTSKSKHEAGWVESSCESDQFALNQVESDLMILMSKAGSYPFRELRLAHVTTLHSPHSIKKRALPQSIKVLTPRSKASRYAESQQSD